MNIKTLVGLLFVLVAASASAEIQPMRINFQGKLINPATNNPNASATVNLTFKLYNDPVLSVPITNLLYTEVQNAVPLTNGVFSVQIGTSAGINRDLFIGASVYIGVTVSGDTEMLPRQSLAMSAYAYTANQLSDLTDVRMIAGTTYSTFTSAGNFTAPGGISGSSGSFTNGVTASSGTFTATGGNFSVVTSSGIQMNGGFMDVNGSGGISNSFGIVTGTLTVTDSKFTVGGSSFIVSGGSATLAYGLTAASATFTGIGGNAYSLTTSSGIEMLSGTMNLQHTSGIRADDTGITISTIDFTGQATDPTSGNAGYMYYNTSSGSLKVFDPNGWNYAFGQSLSRTNFTTTTGGAAGAISKTAAQMEVEPFYLPGPMMVRQLIVDETTAMTANGDIGVYTSTGGLYLHGGANSLTNTTGLKTVTVTGGPIFLPPGQYYAVLTWNGAAGRFWGDALPVAGIIPNCGTVAAGGGTTLPPTMTFPITATTVYFMFEMNP